MQGNGSSLSAPRGDRTSAIGSAADDRGRENGDRDTNTLNHNPRATPARNRVLNPITRHKAKRKNRNTKNTRANMTIASLNMRGRYTVREAQSRHLCRAFTLMFYGLQNIFRKESRYFLQYLNKFPFMVIVSNFEEITPPPTNLKVPNLWSDFSVSNSVKFNFLNRPPNKKIFDQHNVIYSSKLRPSHDITAIAKILEGQKRIGVCGCLSCCFCASRTVLIIQLSEMTPIGSMKET